MASDSVRSNILKLCKQNLSQFPIWERIEEPIIQACSNFTEPTDDKRSKKFIEELEQLKALLIEKDVTMMDLNFLTEEIDNLQQINTMSLFVEDEDDVDPETIERYARLGANTEGIVYA